MKSFFKKYYKGMIVAALALTPILVSFISMIHVVNFFELSNYKWLAIVLAVAFEIGALSSLAALAVMDKISKGSMWMIFILVTAIQCVGNTYYAYDFVTDMLAADPQWINSWTELFALNEEEDIIYVKRLLAIITGAILPIISLGFTHMLVEYINNEAGPSKPKADAGYVVLKDLAD